MTVNLWLYTKFIVMFIAQLHRLYTKPFMMMMQQELIPCPLPVADSVQSTLLSCQECSLVQIYVNSALKYTCQHAKDLHIHTIH